MHLSITQLLDTDRLTVSTDHGPPRLPSGLTEWSEWLGSSHRRKPEKQPTSQEHLDQEEEVISIQVNLSNDRQP